MSAADADDPSVNGRLRPRKNSLAGPPPPPPPPPPSRARPARKPNDDKTRKPPTPTKKPPEKADDASKSIPYLKSLCPYCSRRFGSRNSVSKHIARTHSSGSKAEPIECQFCKHSEVEAGDIVRHMVDSHPNQYFACLECHSRFPSTSELAVHKLHVCERQKPHSYRNKLRQKPAEAPPAAEYATPNFNGIVISCELKPCQERDTADIEDNITTNLILPSGKNSLVSTSMLEKNAVIVLDDIQWNKRMPPNFNFHNSDADQILSRLGVVHRSPRTSDNARWYKHIEDTTKFERCFDTTFYSKVASNVQENLKKFLDGSFNRFQLDPENVIKTRRAKNSVVINTAEGFPILLAHEQYSRNMFDSYMPRAIAPKHKWKWDSIESDRHPINPDQIKRDSHVNNCIITLVSSLDIWTQLRMRHKFEAKFNISSFNEKNTEKQNLIVNELKEILESRVIPRRDSVCQARHASRPVASTSNAEFPGSLGLMRATPSQAAPPAVLSGEWVRPRCYVCCACGDKAQDSKQLSAHISAQHPLAQVSHYEVVGESLLGADILKHLYVPPSQPSSRSRPLRGVRECTKCRKPTTLEELHQHMLECAGDTPAVRRKVRSRPFGVRRRRTRLPDDVLRNKTKRLRRPQRLKNRIRPRPRIRTEVGDAETIRKMIADLPAKRHRVSVTTPNPLLRTRRMREQPRKKLLMKRRPSDNPKMKKQRGGRDFASPGTSGTPNKGAGTSSKEPGPSGTQRNPNIAKPRISRISANVMRQSDVLKRKTLMRNAKRKARAIIEAASKEHFEDPPRSASSSKAVVTESFAADNTLDRIDVNKEVGDPRGHAAREGNGSQDGRKTGGGENEQSQNGQNNRAAPNTPLKHSIARLTAATETHDKSVQFQPHFLVQQECYKNIDRPVEPQRLFENDIAAAKVDKPPLFDLNQSPGDLQKNKANKPRKRLNDCIAMLKNKLIEPESPDASAGHRSVQCDTADMPQYSSPPMPQLPEYITQPLVSSPAPTTVTQKDALAPSTTLETGPAKPCLTTTPPSLSKAPFTAESSTVTRSTRYRAPASTSKPSVTVTRSSTRSSAAAKSRQKSAPKPDAVLISPPSRTHSTDGRATRRSAAKAQAVIAKVPPVQPMGPPGPVMPPASSKSPVSYTPWALSKSPVNVRPPSPARSPVKSPMTVCSPSQEKSPGYYTQSPCEKSPSNYMQVPIESPTANTYVRDKSPGNYSHGTPSQPPLLYMPQSYAQSLATYPPRAPERLTVNPPQTLSKSPVNYPPQTQAKSPVNYPLQGSSKSPVTIVVKPIPKTSACYSQLASENSPTYCLPRDPLTDSPATQNIYTMPTSDTQGTNYQPKALAITSQPPAKSPVNFLQSGLLTGVMSPLVIEPPQSLSVLPPTAAKSPKASPLLPSNRPQVAVIPATTLAVDTHTDGSYASASSPSARVGSMTAPGIVEMSLPAIPPISNLRPVDMHKETKYPLLQMNIPPAHVHTSAVTMISPLDLSGKSSGPTFLTKSTYEDSYETLDLSNKGASIDNKTVESTESTDLTKDDVVDLCIKKSMSLETIETLDLSAKIHKNAKGIPQILEPTKESEPLHLLPEAKISHEITPRVIPACGSECMLKPVTLKIPQFKIRPTTSTCTTSEETDSMGGNTVAIKSVASSITASGPPTIAGDIEEISNTPDTTMVAPNISQVGGESKNNEAHTMLTPIEASIAACSNALSATMSPQLATSLMNSLVSLPRSIDTAVMTTTSTNCTTSTDDRRAEIVVPIGSVEDLETAKKIAMLPKEILEILGKMPTDHRNQLLDVLPQYMVYNNAVKQLKLVVDITPDSLTSPVGIAKLASSKSEIATQTSSTSTEEVCPPEFLNVDTEKFLIDPFTGAITERAQQESEIEKRVQDEVIDMTKEATTEKTNVEQAEPPVEEALNLMAANKDISEKINTFTIPAAVKINKQKESSEKTASLRAVRIKTSERRMSQQNMNSLINKAVQQLPLVSNSVVSEKEELRAQLESKTPPAIQQAEVSSTQQNGNRSTAIDITSPVAAKDINLVTQNKERRSSAGIDEQDSSNNSMSVDNPKPKTIVEPPSVEENVHVISEDKAINISPVSGTRSRVTKKVTKKTKCKAKVLKEMDAISKDDIILPELSASKLVSKNRIIVDHPKAPNSDDSDDDDLSLAVILKNKKLIEKQELKDSHNDKKDSKKGRNEKTKAVTKNIPALLPANENIEKVVHKNENPMKYSATACVENKIDLATTIIADVHTLQTKKNNEPTGKKKNGRRRFTKKENKEETADMSENSAAKSVLMMENTTNHNKENNDEPLNMTSKNVSDKVNSDSVLSTVDTRINHTKSVHDQLEKQKQDSIAAADSSIEKTDGDEVENLNRDILKTKPDVPDSTASEETLENVSIPRVIETNKSEKKLNFRKSSKKRKKHDFVETMTQSGTINNEFTETPGGKVSIVDRTQAEEIKTGTPAKYAESPKVEETKVQFSDTQSIDKTITIEEDAIKTKSVRSTRSRAKDSPKTVSSDDLALSLCSGDSIKPLRRSRRGKSMFVEKPILDTPEPMQTDIYMENKAPLTKKQLIFSKLLLDEENSAKLSTNSLVPPEVEALSVVDHIEESVSAKADRSDYTPDVTMDESNCIAEPVVEMRKPSKRKKSPHYKQHSKRMKSYEKDNCQYNLLCNKLSSEECQETPEENKHPEFCKDDPKIEAKIGSIVDSDETPKIHLTEEVTAVKDETVPLQIEPENAHKKQISSGVDTKEVMGQCKKPKHSTEKRKCDRAINVTAAYSPKVKKTKKQLVNALEAPDQENLAAIEDSMKDTSIRRVGPTKQTTCYDMPRAAARTRAKSLLIKSFMDEIYDPYDIDLEDKLLQDIEPITKTTRPVQDKQEHDLKPIPKDSDKTLLVQDKREHDIKPISKDSDKSRSVQEKQERDIKPISEDSDKKNTKKKSRSSISSDDVNRMVTSSHQDITSNGKDSSSDSDSSKSDVPLQKYADENAKAQKKSFKAKDAANSEQEAPVPSEQPVNKRKNGGKRRKKVEQVAEDKEESPEKQLENAEELRSEQFMESFGFFSERKPRKSNLLASKKISETFHIIATENDDLFYRNKERAAKRGDRRKSASVSHTYDLECTARGIAHCHARRGRRGRRKRVPNPLTFCEICRKEFRRPDNYLRHQMTFVHIERLAAKNVKADPDPLPDIPNYLVIYRQHLDRLRRLTEKLQRKNKKLGRDPSLIKIPTIQDIIADAKIHQYNLQKNNVRRGLSRDEALFLHCCELLKSSQNEIPSISYSHRASETVTSRSMASNSTAMASTSNASSGKCNDGDVDSITAKTIMESEEVRNLENDLISGIKEAVTHNLAAAGNQKSYDYDTGVEHTSDLDAHDLDLDSAVPEFEVRLAQQRRSSGEDLPDKLSSPKAGDSPFEELDSAEEPARVRKARRSAAKLSEMLDIDLFEDKFDKIKRKCRSQAAAAKNTQPSTEPSPSTSGTSSKAKKKADKKKTRKSSSKNQNMIMTKGALKGFDGFKVSIPTTDINMAAIVSSLGESPRSKKKSSGKNRREQTEEGGKHEFVQPSSSGQTGPPARDPPAGARGSLDVYEFLDNDDADLFPSVIKDRYKTFKAPLASREPFCQRDDDSASGSDGDDFVYMSDDYPCSADETENSVMSCELPASKPSLEPKKAALKRKDAVEKNAVMGKIFKNNAVRTDKKSSKAKDAAKSSTANLDQLFDSLLEEEPAGTPEEPKAGPSGHASPPRDRRATPLPNSDSESEEPFGAASPVPEALPDRTTGESTGREATPEQTALARRRQGEARRWASGAVMSPSSTLDDPQPGTSRDSLPYELSDGEADGGVARHRARRKCTVGKQNILAESWSSESEPDGAMARANSTESVLMPAARKKKGKKGSGAQQAPKRLRHVTFKKQEVAASVPSLTPPVGEGAGGGAAEGGGRPPVPSPYAWSPEGDAGAPAHAPQHGWIVGNSHKKLVTMLAHAKGRHREDKRNLDE